MEDQREPIGVARVKDVLATGSLEKKNEYEGERATRKKHESKQEINGRRKNQIINAPCV